MTGKGVTRRTVDLEPAWRTDELPEGPVDLYVAVFSDDARPLGVAPAGGVSWGWQNGMLKVVFAPIRVVLAEQGRYASAYFIAVAEGWWRPVFCMALPPPAAGRPVPELRVGDYLTVRDAGAYMDFSGTPNDPSIPPGGVL